MPSPEAVMSEEFEKNRKLEVLHDVLSVSSIVAEKKPPLLTRGSSKMFLEDSKTLESSYRSAPSREHHEKLLRDFFEIMLDEAIFKVSEKVDFSQYLMQSSATISFGNSCKKKKQSVIDCCRNSFAREIIPTIMLVACRKKNIEKKTSLQICTGLCYCKIFFLARYNLR